jgi:hypothetical protein
MNKNYKNCEKGHFFSANLKSCPHCEVQNESGFIYSKGDESNIDNTDKTVIMSDHKSSARNTTVDDNEDTYTCEGTIPLSNQTSENSNLADRTVVFSKSGEQNEKKGSRHTSARKLVGWLVSYTITEFGIDFRLYEGQNTVGRDSSCTVRISEDTSISTKHATILFRNHQFYLRDEMSTNPSFVNGEEVMPGNTVKLNDGDSITIGKTVLFIRETRIGKNQDV